VEQAAKRRERIARGERSEPLETLHSERALEGRKNKMSFAPSGLLSISSFPGARKKALAPGCFLSTLRGFKKHEASGETPAAPAKTLRYRDRRVAMNTGKLQASCRLAGGLMKGPRVTCLPPHRRRSDGLYHLSLVICDWSFDDLNLAGFITNDK
jgi:hypothetical protein